MEYGLALIDKASEMCGGSAYKLAKAWGVSQTMITLIKKGERKLPIRRVPKLAELAGVDPREAMLRVAEEQAEEGSETRDLLGKAMAGIAAVMLLFFIIPVLLLPSPSYASEITQTNKLSLLYIVECLREFLLGIQRRFFRRLGFGLRHMPSTA